MKNFAFALISLMLLTSCGSTHKDRAISGAGIGAGIGTASGLLIGGPVGGLLLGSAVGTLTGLITEKDQINLGNPLWNRNASGSTPSATSAKGSAGKASGDKDPKEVTKDWDFDILD